MLLRIFIYLVLKRPSRLVSCIFGAVQTVLLLVPLIELGYFSYYYTTISTAASIAFLQSNPNEVKEYLLQNIGVLGIFCFIVGVSLLCIFLIRQNKLEISSKENNSQEFNQFIFSYNGLRYDLLDDELKIIS